ncbi:TetR/AcrR family transcriptional regulator [Muricomes intestini]|jgi:AcrR family transcriptional regulator|uniref:TetR family transcriptional regulator n=1 Tax=Muricomes intestini TaxID=1796634 RepID=A0A4R3K6U7_9FIRM|nr:TetR/AcrR family transcriptional regulator [Muricomes intestini]TCS78569.1 TetR family transcriptional regulator [Muricomes intestini]HAX52310.1 TetR/AcrR family transcriptional regulator [Lachnospiraceae bacterium]HCR83359.1 TetR/AcrR family transcriptional regulator [Lachnospiraceae bacterium]
MPRKKQTTKDRIVKAAWTLFYKNGYDDTTVEDILKLSRTSKGTFYHYFKGKDALLSTLSVLFDQKYEEINPTMDPSLSAEDKLLLLNHELFYMIENSIDLNLLASLLSSQLVTKDNRSLLDADRYYFQIITEIIDAGIQSGEFKATSSVDELVKIYAMYERALLYDWALCAGKYSLSEYSDKLLPHVLDNFRRGI